MGLDNGVRLPLVGQELDRTLTGEARAEAMALLEQYIRWAPSVDRFAPVLVETDFEAADNQEEGRLGGRSWAMGRGAAPPKFGRDRRG